jgi:opacity protein-like surface antigen
MKTKHAFGILFAALSAAFASTSALADNPLGVYVGAAIGGSLSRSKDNSAFNNYAVRFHQDNVEWKGFVGVRPLPMLGVELAYIDFGNASGSPPPGTIFGYFKGNSKESATTLFGVGYLPLPVPFLELYGKLGAARLHTETQVSYAPPTCPVGMNCTVSYTLRQNRWTTDFAYGAGVQAHFSSVGIRVEYERIAASGGNPDLFSLGVAWSF